MSSPRFFPDYDLPIILNTRHLLAVVVGGGRVGPRKARTLLADGVAVRVVAPELQPHDLNHDRLEWRSELYKPHHLDGARLVYTAAPADVSWQVHQDARDRGLLVCRADNARAGDFITPMTVRRGRRLRVAVSTGGASPALVRRIHGRLAEMFDKTFGEWVELLEFWRYQSDLALSDPPENRREFLEQISDWKWLDLYRTSGKSAVADAYQDLAARLGMKESPRVV